MAASFELSPSQRRTLEALCEAFVPRLNDHDTAQLVRNRITELKASGRTERLDEVAAETIDFCRRSALDTGVPASVERVLKEHAPPDVVGELSILLTAMSTRIGMLALCGTPVPFADLEQASREAVLQQLALSWIPSKRKVFSSLQKLILIKSFGDSALSGGANLSWKVIGYPSPEPFDSVRAVLEKAGRKEHHFRMINATITSDTVLEFDVVIVGSGCGGSVVAAELAAAGHRVLVLEKGTYYPLSELTALEGDGLDRLYERGGTVTTEDTGMVVLAGSTFGGGSTVNWACSLRTPDHVRQEWAEKHGLHNVNSDIFTRSLDHVCARISVTGDGVSHNRNNELLLDGCNKCGYQINVAPQSMADVSKGAPGAGLISVGDRYMIKQSMTVTFLKDAATSAVPASFGDRCRIEKVIHKDGVARGVVGQIHGAEGQLHQLEVRARAVVVSCGSIHSPALLLRSNLPNRNKQIGKNLRLHPVSAVVYKGTTGEPDVAIWNGAPMTTVCNEGVSGPSEDFYGSRLECPSLHPGFGASFCVLPGRHLKESFLDFPRLAATIVLVRDKGSGEVRLDKRGEPRLYYQLDRHDEQSMTEGLERAIRAAAAVGAEEIATTQHIELENRVLPPPAMAKERAEAVETLVRDMKSFGFPLHRALMFSAHQMGTCKMGSSAADSVVDENGQSWEISGLFVADASTFPTSSGTNPMITTLAIAHMISQGLKKHLQTSSKL